MQFSDINPNNQLTEHEKEDFLEINYRIYTSSGKKYNPQQKLEEEGIKLSKKGCGNLTTKIGNKENDQNHHYQKSGSGGVEVIELVFPHPNLLYIQPQSNALMLLKEERQTALKYNILRNIVNGKELNRKQRKQANIVRNLKAKNRSNFMKVHPYGQKSQQNYTTSDGNRNCNVNDLNSQQGNLATSANTKVNWFSGEIKPSTAPVKTRGTANVNVNVKKDFNMNKCLNGTNKHPIPKQRVNGNLSPDYELLSVCMPNQSQYSLSQAQSAKQKAVLSDENKREDLATGSFFGVEEKGRCKGKGDMNHKSKDKIATNFRAYHTEQECKVGEGLAQTYSPFSGTKPAHYRYRKSSAKIFTRSKTSFQNIQSPQFQQDAHSVQLSSKVSSLNEKYDQDKLSREKYFKKFPDLRLRNYINMEKKYCQYFQK